MRGPATETDELTQPPGTLRQRRDGYTLVRTPGCSTYHCGNSLVLDEAPEDLVPWIERFRADLPDVAQLHLEWESESVVAGSTSVNHLGAVRAPERLAPLKVRPLETCDWTAQMALAIATVEERFPGSRPYSEWRNSQHRAQVAAGLARWWGAFLGEQLVASAGLYESARWARFQNVITTPEHRGQGACTTLMHAMCVDAAARRPSNEVVIVAASGSQAERIYLRVGFEPIGTQFDVSRPLG